MKVMLRAIAAAAAAVAAGSAYADIAPPIASSATAGNGGELFFYAFNEVTGESYVRDLGVRVSNFLPSGPNAPVDGTTYAFSGAFPNGPIPGGTPAGNVTGPTLGNPYTFTWTDPGMVNFFGASDFNAATWGILAHQAGAGQERFLVSTNNIGPGGITNGEAQGYAGAVDTFVAQLNAVMNGTAQNTNTYNDISLSASPADPFNALNLGNRIGNSASYIAVTPVGASAKFYALNGDGTQPPTNIVSQQYGNDVAVTARWTLGNDGVLQYTAVAAIPEPGTWAMLTAGLLAIGAVARRRLSA